MIEGFGIRNEQRDDGLPHPGTIVVGPGGKVIAKLFFDGYRKRHTSQEIIDALK